MLGGLKIVSLGSIYETEDDKTESSKKPEESEGEERIFLKDIKLEQVRSGNNSAVVDKKTKNIRFGAFSGKKVCT